MLNMYVTIQFKDHTYKATVNYIGQLTRFINDKISNDKDLEFLIVKYENVEYDKFKDLQSLIVEINELTKLPQHKANIQWSI